MTVPADLARIATALEQLVAIERDRDARRRAPRPKRERQAPVPPEARAKGRALLRKIGVR